MFRKTVQINTLSLRNLEAGNHVEDHSVEERHTLSIHDIHYEVDVRTRLCCGSKVKKKILKGITGIFKPGMNAILGPTGSGKSSLLDVLAGRKDTKYLSGDVLLDGSPPPQNFKCMVGYVIQNDCIMGTLTIRENLNFSASLRLPSSVSEEERTARVNQIIQELGLTECADRKLGTEYIRGVSGGERKRTNIGMELIIAPPVLFLDEPTSGLDANTANAVMYLLKTMADKGQTIIFSIHQPRYSIFKVFDYMTLLAAGEMVYFGPANKAIDHFKSMGFVCEEHNNPADFFLDVVGGDPIALPDINVENFRKDKEGSDYSLQKKLVDDFKASEIHSKLMTEAKDIHDAYMKNVQNGSLVKRPPVEYASSFPKQLRIVAARAVKNILRNPRTSVIQLFLSIFFSLIVGSVYFRINTSIESGIQNRIGVFFFLIMSQIFGSSSAVELFITERAIFIHENVSGFYRVSTYFLAKVFCDVIPLRLIPAICYSVIVYWMIGLDADVGKFFFFVCNFFLTSLSAATVVFAISAGTRIFSVASLSVSLSFVLMMLFGGFLRNLNDMAPWLSWLKWLSLFRYSLDALTINELKDKQFCTGKNCTSGNSYMDTQGIVYDTAWDLWHKELALAIFIAIGLMLTYIQLRRIQKLR